MWVHKRSRGVLPEKMALTELSPEAWWQVPDRTTLGRKILRLYPAFDPVINDKGQLLDVIPWGKRRTRRVDRGGPADPKRDWRHCHDKRSRLCREKGEKS